MHFRKMIENVKTGQPIILAEGTGLHFNPVYVDDVCDVVVKLSKQELTLGQYYNLFGPYHITLGDVVMTLNGICISRAGDPF